MGTLLQLFQLLLLLLSLAVLFVSPIEGGDAISLDGHHCIHDTVQMKPADMPFVQAKGSSTTSKRQNEAFSSIRIHTILDPSATTWPKFSNIFVDPYGPFQRALTVLSGALLVRPFQGNLTIPPLCTNKITNGSNAGKCFADSVDTATACGSFFNVSADLVGTIEACNTTSSPCTDVGPDGPGVAETDFVLFAGAADSPDCGASAPASSSSCAKDNYYRPSAGYINICPDVLSVSQDDQIFQMVLHELIHVLGFSANLMPTFINEDGQTYNPVSNFVYDGTVISGLTSPKVVALGQEFFSCSSLEYVALENNDGFGITSSHWEARILLHETMSSVLSIDYNIFSNFTLRYFEDSGWYKVNYTYTNALPQYQLLWGKGLGCDFVFQSCDNPNTYPYHCNHLNTTHQCTFDGISKGTCKQSHFLDGCYTVLPDSNGVCITVNNATSFVTERNITEVYGSQSRCFEHSDVCNSTVSFSCLATRLVRHNASGLLAYYIATDGKQLWCREDEQVYVEERLVTCPSTEFILLRADPSMITTVEYIPPPLCHKSCSSCAVMDDATQCLSCPSDSLLLGKPPSNCSAVPEEYMYINVTDCPCTDGDLRLMDGSTQYEGRVEICLDGEWGVVCDDGFGSNDAKVVCRQLGFDDKGAQSLCCSNFGSGAPLPMTIDYLYCTGSESAILDCAHNGDGVSSCHYFEAAGVRCGAPCLSDDQVDLVITYGSASNITSGIVRVCNGGSGGVVCDSGWDFADARVACKAAGYSPYGAVSLVNQYLSSASYPPLMNNVGCSGNETYLSECPSSDLSCSYYDYAGVTCQDVEFVPENCTHGDIRLVGGLKSHEGRVEVCINEVWGTVCDISWSSADANVACRQAGFSGSGATARTNAFYGQGNGPILLSGLTCSGFESSLLSCSRSPPSSSCDHLDDSGVTCQKPCDGSAEFLSYFGSVITSTGSPVSGIVRVCYQSSQFLVCDYGWDFAGAKVACRSAGLSPYGAVRLLNQFSYYLYFYSSISNVHCQGNESSLANCSFSLYSFCYYSDYAGAYCQGPNTTSDGCNHGDIRLRGGTDEREGRVEVCVNEVWGTVCDSSWSSADAKVACRQAGFKDTGAIARINAYYGQGSGPVLLSSLSCSGTESSLLSCSFSAPPSYCDHSDDAGVKCQGPCVDGTVEILDSYGAVSSGTFGIVSVCMNKTRTVLCDFSWDNLDARVLCKQLGFSEYGAAAVKSQYLPGQSLGYYASLCKGNESDLQQCLSSSYSSYCSYSTLAAVSCQANVSIPDNCTDGTVRLVGGTVPYEGNVQICYNNLWGVICDSGWSSSDAQVICKQLGYLFFGALPSINSYYGSSPMPVYKSYVGCSSSYSNIEQCSASYTATCGSDDYAGVRCGGSCNTDSLSLLSGSTLSNGMSGIIQTCVFGVRGVICDYNWDHTDARVACEQLGFSPYGALASINQYLSSTYSCSLPDLLTNVNCTGQETSLSECPFEYGTCSYFNTAGVVCQNTTLQPDNCTHGDIKLVGGNGKHEGTVHICINQVWGTICDSGWGSVDAGIVCQQLGYQRSGAQYLFNSFFGKGSGQVFLTSVGCSTSSSNILECYYSLVSPTSYCNAHYDDVGVICEAPCEDDGLVDLITSSGALSATASGMARVCADGHKGTVCDYGWGFTDAIVACRAAGYSPYGAVPLDDQYLSPSASYLPVMSYVNCIGNETALTQCPYSEGSCSSYYSYAGVVCQSQNTNPDNCTHGQVRLAGSSSPWQGRVEVCINSLWSTVCDGGWSSYDARAVCAQVGYPGTEAQALTNSFFGDGTAPALINNVGCWSYSTNLLDCSFSGPSSYCLSNNAAGVICEVPCSDGLVQLIQSSGGSGVVKLCDNSKRYLICDYGWDHVDASVACKSIGLSPYGAVALFNQYVSSISGYSFLSYVNCNGSESNLTECESTPRSYSCYNNYAGIRCQVIDTVPDNCTHGAVRLVGGTNQYEGNVEVCINGVWSTICDSGWSSSDARVACGDAGYPGAGASTRVNSYFGVYDDKPMLLSYLGCYGSEVSLLDCSFSNPSSSCDKYDIAGVVCEAPCSDGSAQLLQYSGSLNYTSGGIVQICFDNKKFLVCDHGWDFADSRVLCQSVGFSPYGAVAIHNQALSYTVYSGLGLLYYVSCNGTETNFTDCEYTVLYSGYCNYNFAAVYCQAATAVPVPDNCTHGDIRLVGGPNEYEGTVEICVNDIWGTVCDSSWGSSDASVACGQLGYLGSGASAQYNARFGTGSGPVLLSGLLCGGSESSLLDCTSSIPSSSCDHFDDAGVICQAPCAEGSVQLIQSTGFLSTSASGIARICSNISTSNSNNNQYLICDYGWDFVDASVTCKSVGYSPYGAVALLNQGISSAAGYSFLGYVNCNGSESNLTECQSQILYGSCYSNYAGAQCQKIGTIPDNCEHGEIRLVGGTNKYEGNVEVCINGIWSTICDSGWSSNDARVACTQAGYPGTGVSTRFNSYFGVYDDKPMLLSYLGCYGSETSLLKCSFRTPSSSCDKYDIAGVVCEAPCEAGSVQLIQSTGYLSTSASGVVRLCSNTSATNSNNNNNNHFLICDYGWGYVDASVACKSAGYSPYGAIILLNQYISSSVGYSFLAYVNCKGSEINLLQCQSLTYYYSCNYNYAGVRCQEIGTVTDNCDHGEIRLVGGSLKYEGNVEICINGVWSTICDSGWSTNDARVACAQAGYPGGGVVTRYNSYFGAYEGKMLLSYVGCSGSQSSLLDCSFSAPSSSCDKNDIAGVTCEAPCIDGEVKFLQPSSGISTASGGVAQICLNNTKYLICDYGWDFLDSKVLCQYLGYSPNGAVVLHNQQLSSSIYYNLPLLRYVACNGTESSLADCDYDILLSGYCNYNFAGVYCQANDTAFDDCKHGEILLDGGFTDYEGNVKICINGVWSTICDSGWSINDARIACAQAGYPGAGSITRANSYYGVENAPMLLSSFYCYGSEASLLDCRYAIPPSSCDQYDIAGVTCEAPCNPGSVSLITPSGSLSSTSSGLVRMCNSDNHHFLVCEYNWDYVDASIACKSAGYSPYGAVRFHNQRISSTTGYSFLSYVVCDGSELTLSECGAEPQPTPCSYNYAGVLCLAPTIIPNNCTHGDIRLVGGSLEYEGNVEVCVNGVWGTICDSYWSTYDALVACAQVGYPGQGAVSRRNSYYGAYDRPMLLSSLTCSGRELSLLDCNFNVPSSSCDSYDISGVKCEAPCTDGVKLLQYSGSLNNTAGGVVQLCVNQTKYLICDDGWDFFSASVLCQILGYSSYGAVALHDQSLTSSAYYNIRHLRNVTCDGTESSFAECTYELSNTAYCNYNYIGVYCQDLGTTPDNCTQGDMKLVGGTTEYEGTLQICVNSVWGTVCDYSWGFTDAVVACSQLGYGGIEVTAEINSKFGPGKGPVLLSGLVCNSDDNHLLECRSSPPSTYCDHSDDAGLTCEVPCVEGSVELRSNRYGYLSSTASGIVTICFNGVRSVICSTNWDFATARIACESLGYSPIGAIPLMSQWLYSTYYNAFNVVNNTNCSGFEANITECDFESTFGYCNYNLAGVNCQVTTSNYQTTSCVDGDIRLVNGSSQYSGRVEICANNVWGTVCDSSWSDYDARVVCNQLGFTGSAASAKRNAFFGPGSGPVLLSGLGCSWSDPSILDCYSYNPDPSYCSHSNDAGVICEAPCTMDYGVDLVYTYSGTISVYNYGAVRLCVNGSRSPICDSGWDDSEAIIACKSAGYSPYGAVAATSQVIYSNDPALKVDCIGNETDISECTVGNGDCPYYNYAGISCQDLNSTYPEDCEHGAVRLVGGTSELQGRVEICINNVWGTICDSGWGVTDARVVCQQLGYSYSGAKAYYNAYFGAGSGPILLSSIYCITGYESSLLSCSYSYPPYYCDHYDDVGVSCTHSKTSCSYGDVRLVGGSLPYEGRVEICINNVWGTVCDDDWGAPDAEVVCRQLGYPIIGAVALPSAAYGKGSGPIFLDNVSCNGAELTLLDCLHNGIAYENCNHNSDAGVKCPAVPSSVQTNATFEISTSALAFKKSSVSSSVQETVGISSSTVALNNSPVSASVQETVIPGTSLFTAAFNRSPVTSSVQTTVISGTSSSTATSNKLSELSRVQQTAVSGKSSSTAAVYKSSTTTGVRETTLSQTSSSTIVMASIFVVLVIIIAIAVVGIAIAVFVIRKKLVKQKGTNTDEVALKDDQDTKSDVLMFTEPSLSEKQDISEM